MSRSDLIDLTGQIFGLLTATEYAPSIRAWLCTCECGSKTHVVSSSLRRGRTSSCGCLRRDWINNRSSKYHVKDPAYKKTASSYINMLQRCNNPNACGYENYGGRGISIAEVWLGDGGFENFLKDMGKRPQGRTLDRFPDKDGDYSPENCRWATGREQAFNKRKREGTSSKYMGVCLFRRTGRWQSKYDNKHLGYFDTEEEAYMARLEEKQNRGIITKAQLWEYRKALGLCEEV